MDNRRLAITVLWAATAFVAAPWFDVMSPSYGIWIVGFCIAAIAYVHLIGPHRHFFEKKNTGVSRSDRLGVALGIVLVTSAIVGAAGAFVRMQFPREMTPVERLQEYYVECRDIERRGRGVDDDTEYADYSRAYTEWVWGARHFIVTHISDAARAKFEAERDSIPGVTIRNSKTAHLAERARAYCVHLEAIIENEEWR